MPDTKLPLSELRYTDFHIGDKITGPGGNGIITELHLDDRHVLWISFDWEKDADSDCGQWCDMRNVYLTGESDDVFWD